MADKRKYPISHFFFKKHILPVIEQDYIWKGRPPKVSHYSVFCAILYVLRTGISWRDLPKEFGDWHVVYDRYNRGSQRGIWWKILTQLQAKKAANTDIIIIDSTSLKVHRHGGGQKGGNKAKASPKRALQPNSILQSAEMV
ncbi:MAG: transposase [Oscillospiraceae bacterium]|nr:transposase [Oscillospiraceae bacterium]